MDYSLPPDRVQAKNYFYWRTGSKGQSTEKRSISAYDVKKQADSIFNICATRIMQQPFLSRRKTPSG
jgi:hypothetical protein